MSSKNNIIKPKKRTAVFDAILFAAKAHIGHYRKATRIPYILHPLGVAKILIEQGLQDEVVIAGILHDTVEDTPVTIEQIRRKFGKKVARLVEGASEPDKSDTWENRKKHTIEHLKKASLNLLYVSCADKLDNIRSMIQDHKKVGEKLFGRFNRPKAQQKWYYTSLAKVFLSRKRNDPLFVEFDKAVRQLFRGF